MKFIKTSNPFIQIEVPDDKVVFEGEYAVVHGISSKIYSYCNKKKAVVGVINKNYEEVRLELITYDNQNYECNDLKFRVDNQEIYNYKGKDFIVQCVLKTDYADIIEYKHIRLVNNKALILSENIANDLTNVKQYNNFLLADDFIYDVENAKIELDNRFKEKSKIAKL
ncbi:MAG TPA: hypothetical protein GX747_02145 [Tenericutes bacterium]|nr:hypothetical protein [Mycoplasmatota bacterium]